MQLVRALKGREGNVIHVAFRYDQVELHLDVGQGKAGTLQLSVDAAQQLIRELDVAVARVAAANRRAKTLLAEHKKRADKKAARQKWKRPRPPLFKVFDESSKVTPEMYCLSKPAACQAKQYSDRMNCQLCNLSWDTNDPRAPDCKR